jgi:hypothetical protein
MTARVVGQSGGGAVPPARPALPASQQLSRTVIAHRAAGGSSHGPGLIWVAFLLAFAPFRRIAFARRRTWD